MDLREAFQILDVDPGASEDAIREARKTLAKVWHPDRHANDPALQAKAQAKLAEINEAFEVVSKAGFPASIPDEKPRSPAAPEPPPKPAPVATPPPVESTIELVPRRRVRWSVILVLAAAIGVGAYLAIVRLGGARETVAAKDASAPRVDAAIIAIDAEVVAIDATEPVAIDAVAGIVRRDKTFTLGSTRDEVIAAQGEPNGTHRQSTTVNGVRTASERLTFGDASSVDFDGNGKVIGWTESDSPLHVRIEIKDATAATVARARGSFTKGSTTDEVVAILGPPTAVAGRRWSWSASWVDFDGTGKVVTWSDGDPKLPAR